MLFDELKRFWRLFRKLAVLIGVLLSFFALLELARAYVTLRDLHPLASYGFLVILGALLAWSIYYFWSAFRSYPRALTPPPRSRTRRYAKYLCRYLQRLQNNDAVPDEQKDSLRDAKEKLSRQLKTTISSDSLNQCIEQIENETIGPALGQLDELAEQKIRTGVRDIMLVVAVSPYRSLDLLVVLYRNLLMIKNVAAVYNSRPALRESLQTVYDTARVVAAVNFVNLGGKMIENLTKSLPGIIPGVSRIVDDCAQGLAAGMLTSVTGHAAKERCRAFAPWDFEKAKSSIAEQLKTFTSDVGKMFFKDITPTLRIPGEVTREKWRELKESLSQGYNDTIDAIQNLVGIKSKRP